jgi:hypothetical protein
MDGCLLLVATAAFFPALVLGVCFGADVPGKLFFFVPMTFGWSAGLTNWAHGSVVPDEQVEALAYRVVEDELGFVRNWFESLFGLCPPGLVIGAVVTGFGLGFMIPFLVRRQFA